jgi:hypothetical protein
MKPSGLRSSDPPLADDAVVGTAAEGPRERWHLSTWLGPITVGVVGLVAVGVAISAIAVVSREPFGDTGGVLPTRPLTTTTAPPRIASSQAPAPPPVTRAPSAAPPAIAPTTVQTTAPQTPPPAPPAPPPPPSPTRPSSTHSQPSSAHPTTHQPFPQETTDFLGPPGTNP